MISNVSLSASHVVDCKQVRKKAIVYLINTSQFLNRVIHLHDCNFLWAIDYDLVMVEIFRFAKACEISYSNPQRF